MNTRIAFSAISILAALTITAGATFAVFTDVATSQDNTFSTGNADLQLADDNGLGAAGTYANDITGATFSNMAPGQTVTKQFWIKNNGTVNLATTVDLEGESLGSAQDLKTALTIKFKCDTNDNGLTDDPGTTAKTVNQWLTDTPESLDTILASTGAQNASSSTSDADELVCQMIGTVSGSAGNEIAGETLSFDARFDGTQTP